MYVSFVLLYFDFWTILVHGRFNDSSHFVHVIDTHYVWAACVVTRHRLSCETVTLHDPALVVVLLSFNQFW